MLSYSSGDDEAIFGPFLGTIILTMAVWIYMYSQRIPFIVNSLKAKKFTSEQLLQPGFIDQVTPQHVRLPSDNLKNLFEVPTLFYVFVLFVYVTKQVDTFYVTASWIFCILRAVHSVYHCTPNHNVEGRFFIYAASTVSLWSMLLRAATVYILGRT